MKKRCDRCGKKFVKMNEPVSTLKDKNARLCEICYFIDQKRRLRLDS